MHFKSNTRSDNTPTQIPYNNHGIEIDNIRKLNEIYVLLVVIQWMIPRTVRESFQTLTRIGVHTHAHSYHTESSSHFWMSAFFSTFIWVQQHSTSKCYECAKTCRNSDTTIWLGVSNFNAKQHNETLRMIEKNEQYKNKTRQHNTSNNFVKFLPTEALRITTTNSVFMHAE